MQEFEIKSYNLTELARLYRPNLCEKSARRTLNNWIDTMPGLKEALAATGFDPSNRRLLTPRQVAIIVEHLGEP